MTGQRKAKKDYRLEWKDWKNLACACRVRIYDGQGEMEGKTVVIATDINVGQSVTNECENIATLVCGENDINSRDLVFIEHYKKEDEAKHRRNDPLFAEHFDRVQFIFDVRTNRFKNPNWSRLSHEEIERIIGTSFIFTREDTYASDND